MRAFNNAHEAMAGTILTRPRIVVQFAILPGAQRLDWHKVGEDNFSNGTRKPGLQNIASSQVALHSRNRPFCGSDLKVAPTFRIKQTAKDGRAVKVRQTSPIYRPIWSDQHDRMAITDNAIRID